MDKFAGRVALVVGAASGIGAAVAARMQSAGALVYCADMNLDGAASVAGELAGSRAIALDVRDETAWAASMETITSAQGRLDILVNCAGISAASPIAETSFAEWRRVLATNLDGAFLATRHGIRAMRDSGGAIVHLGSASGTKPSAGAAAYSTSKAALRMLVKTAAKECRAAGLAIRINLVSPAGVKTPMWGSMPFFQELVARTGSEELAYAEMSKAGGGLFIEPDAVARAVCFFAGDDARHITGVELPVDDGYVL
jgi:2-keto-3-deoxy-L-fuconate dehydrogenase